MNSTLMDTIRYSVESHPYRIEVFRCEEGTADFSNKSRGFYAYASTRFNGEDWVDQTIITRGCDRAVAKAEVLCRNHWKNHIKPTMEKTK